MCVKRDSRSRERLKDHYTLKKYLNSLNYFIYLEKKSFLKWIEKAAKNEEKNNEFFSFDIV